MKERINWIDWGKAIAVIIVVICHLPQSQEWFYFRFLQSCVISIFFFLSGYLKKDRGSLRENWRKYWHSLIVPYIIYNVVVYPYWLTRYYLQNGGMPDPFTAMKPVIGALLFEHESTFAEPLNGPLWYLSAILFMHITIDWCRKTRFMHQIMMALCIISFFLFAANKYWEFLPNLTPMGIFRRLPYYYLGYVMGQQGLFRKICPKRDIALCTLLLSTSILLFYWHLHEQVFLLHIALFYPVNFCFIFGVLHGCKLLNNHATKAVVNLSVGTLVIVGLHTTLIGGINLLVEKTLQLASVPCYDWYEAVTLALFICALLYPLILFGQNHAPALLGKKGG